MRTLSIRSAAAIAYERGEEFDPGAMSAPTLIELLSTAAHAGSIVPEPSPLERRRRRERERRAALAQVPDWFSPCDLVAPVVPGAPGRVAGGELVERAERRSAMSAMIGTYADGGAWIAFCVLERDGEYLLVDELHAQPDDPDADGAVVRHYRGRERALAEGAARVLALGGELDAEPEQIACSPVRGQARAELRPDPRIASWRERDGRDSTPVERAQAERMFGADLERYLHVLGCARSR
jgi:hypothetical protein